MYNLYSDGPPMMSVKGMLSNHRCVPVSPSTLYEPNVVELHVMLPVHECREGYFLIGMAAPLTGGDLIKRRYNWGGKLQMTLSTEEAASIVTDPGHTWVFTHDTSKCTACTLFTAQFTKKGCVHVRKS